MPAAVRAKHADPDLADDTIYFISKPEKGVDTIIGKLGVRLSYSGMIRRFCFEQNSSVFAEIFKTTIYLC